MLYGSLSRGMGGEMFFGGKMEMDNEDCKCSDCVLKILLVILSLLGILVLVFFVCQMVREILPDKTTPPAYFNTLLSGIIGAGISAGLVYAGLREGNKAKQIENQIKLRELFSEKQRWEVYRTIQSGFLDTSYWYHLEEENKHISKNEKIACMIGEENFSETFAYKYYFYPALCDYIGLFEVAYMMIKKGQLSKKNFEASYRYRIENLMQTDTVKKIITGKERIYWKNFIELAYGL